MAQSTRIRVTADKLTALLEGRPVTTVFQGPRCPARLESYPLLVQEATDVQAIVTGSRLHPRAKRIWTLELELDSTESPLLLNAESAGGVIAPIESGPTSAPRAHGYIDKPSSAVLDAGEAVPHSEVETFTSSQRAARRFAAEKVDVLTKRRNRSLSNRVYDLLMQTRARGMEPDVDGLEAWLEAGKTSVKEAA